MINPLYLLCSRAGRWGGAPPPCAALQPHRLGSRARGSARSGRISRPKHGLGTQTPDPSVTW
eukprot:11410573-Alexandrium_andersonii.AAC.1